MKPATGSTRESTRPYAGRLATVLTGCLLVLAGCGNTDPLAAPAQNAIFMVHGTITGLTGKGLALTLNGAQPLAVSASGGFAFSEGLADGSSYTVAIESQPSDPRQECTVSNGNGTVAGADVDDVKVACVTATFQVAGSVTGLEGSGLTLSLNDGAQSVTVGRGETSFTFSDALDDGTPYTVAVVSQPTNPAQTCTIQNGSGNVGDDLRIGVACVTNPAVPALDFTKLAPSCFTGGAVPQLDLAGPVTDWTFNDPHVLKQADDEYWMYASATDAFVFPVRLYRLTSTDGTAWALNPDVTADQGILPDATEGTWDAGGLETPAVVFFKNQYHLFYTGYRYPVGHTEHSIDNYSIGHAVSDDGVSFSRPVTEPIVSKSGPGFDANNAWYAYIVAEPGPVVFNGDLYVYFTALGVDFDVGASLQVIGFIRTSDGINWSEPQLAMKPRQDIYPRGSDWIGYSTPNAIVLDDRVHLFVDVAHQPSGGDWKQLRLHHASSTDAISGWTQDGEAIASAGDFSWAVDEIRSPHALLDGDLLRLYFAGHKLDATPFHFGTGMMTCDLGAD